MKLLKRLLSVLLVMALAFSLLLPVAYAEEGEAATQEIVAQEVDTQEVEAQEVEAAEQEVAAQETPVITIVKQPKGRTKTATNKEISFSVEAKIPENVNGTLRYQWYQLDKDGVATELAGETSSVLRLRLIFDDLAQAGSDGDVYEPRSGAGPNSLYYYVVIICDYTEDGQEKSVNAMSEKTEVFLYHSLPDYFRAIWQLASFIIFVKPKQADDKVAKWYIMAFLPIIIPMLIINTPVYYLRILFR